jgi:poly-gamma-glutamate synthesis protein (capsule biosynthesis protein)
MNENIRSLITKKKLLLSLYFAFLIVYSHDNAFSQKLTLLFAGDAMQHQSQINSAFRNGKYDYSSCFQYIKDEVSAADLAVVNLEVTLAGKPYKGYPQFSAPDEYARALKEAGFDLFLNANNHIADRGNAGILRTLSALDSMEILHTGVFRDMEDRRQNYPLLIEKEGICLAFLNCTYGTNGIKVSPPVCVNYIDKVQIKEDIQKAKDLNVDLIIATMHWGVEYQLKQNKEQKALADFLIEEGVDLIIGAHPHVIQPSQAITDSTGQITNVIIYSLGNLVSGMIAPNTEGGQMVKVTLEKINGKMYIQSAGYTLLYRHKTKGGKKTEYTVIPVGLAEKNSPGDTCIVMDTVSYRKMTQFARNARAVLNKHKQNIPEYKPLTPEERANLLPDQMRYYFRKMPIFQGVHFPGHIVR